MAKNKKGNIRKKDESQKKSDIREKNYDFRLYAKEFEKLLDKKYKMILDNEKVVTFSFDKGNFYHLLGFHKFENVIFYSMIHDETIEYTKQDFFDDVYNGNIMYSGFDHDKIKIPEKFSKGSFANSFKEHELTDKTRHTLEDRFPFFTYDNVIQILENKEVVRFERDQSDYDVRATKILFHFISDKNRHLNIFLDEDKNENCFVTSFYLESKKNIYKYKKDGTKMDTFHVVCLYIEENKNHQAVQFSVDWAMLRNLVGKGCDIYDKMKRLLKKGLICTRFLEDNLTEITRRIDEITSELGELRESKTVLSLEIAYNITPEDNKEEYVLKLMDHNIDVESILLDQNELRKKFSKISHEIKEKKKLIGTLENKRKVISLSLCEIEGLDKNVLKKIYLPLIENSLFWKEEFWDYFIHNFDYLREKLTPRDLRNIYKKWRENSLI